MTQSQPRAAPSRLLLSQPALRPGWCHLLEFTRSFAQITHLNFKDRTKSFVVQRKTKHRGLWMTLNFKSLPTLAAPWAVEGSPTHPTPTPTPSSHCPGDSQGPKLGHMVETGHGNGGDVVVVQGPERDRRTFNTCPAGLFTGDLSAHIKSLRPAVTFYLDGDQPCSGYGGGGTAQS